MKGWQKGWSVLQSFCVCFFFIFKTFVQFIELKTVYFVYGGILIVAHFCFRSTLIWLFFVCKCTEKISRLIHRLYSTDPSRGLFCLNIYRRAFPRVDCGGLTSIALTYILAIETFKVDIKKCGFGLPVDRVASSSFLNSLKSDFYSVYVC